MILVHHGYENEEHPEYWYWEAYDDSQSQTFATEEEARRAKRRGDLEMRAVDWSHERGE